MHFFCSVFMASSQLECIQPLSFISQPKPKLEIKLFIQDDDTNNSSSQFKSLSLSHQPKGLCTIKKIKKLTHTPPKSPLLPLLKQTSNSLLTSEVPRREQSLSCSYYITQCHVNSPRSSNLNDQQTIFGHNSLKDSNKLNNSDMSSTGHFC